MTLSTDVRAWIEQQTGGRIANAEQQVRWREQHFVTIEKDGETFEVVVRYGRDPRIVKHSELLSRRDIDHEARVLQALQGHDVRVPRLLGFNEDERFILMERLPGSNLLADAPDDDARRAIMFEYYDELANLHSLDIGEMSIEGIDVPSTPEEIAFSGKFVFNERAYLAARESLPPDPLLDLARWWLHENVPRTNRPAVVVQGDTGPGQFLFDDGHVTGLIDWELAHVGDPMLDLGVARMRNMLYPAGSLREPIAHYADSAEGGVDWQALGFYTVLSMLFTPLGIASSLYRSNASAPDLLARYEWDITLRRGLCDALAEVLGLDPAPPDLPAAEEGGVPTLADLLADQLETNVAKGAKTDHETEEIGKAISLARALQLDARIGSALAADDLDDMAAVLGRRPADLEEGMAGLGVLVDENPGEHLEALVEFFSRHQRRREHLWRPMMRDSASEAFERLLPTEA